MSADVLRFLMARAACAAFLISALFCAGRPGYVSAANWEREIGGERREFSGETVVGATFPFTGEFEYYGQSAYYGAAERVRMINDNGGINGKRLVVEWRDNRSDTRLAVEQIREFGERKLPAVIGPLLSDSANAVGDLAERYKFVAISPMSTRNTVVRDDGWVFRASYNNMAQAEALVRFQTSVHGVKSVGIIHDTRHVFSTELSNFFARQFSRRGGQIVAAVSILNPDRKKDYAAAIAHMAEKKPDVIFAPLYALEAVELMNALQKAGLDIPVCGSDTWDNELVFDAAGRRLVNTSFSSPLFGQDADYPPFRDFFKAMELTGMENPDAQAACAWDAVSMLAEALKNGETAESIRDSLAGLSDFPLATGRLSILAGHETRKPVHIRTVEEKNNRLVPVFVDSIEVDIAVDG